MLKVRSLTLGGIVVALIAGGIALSSALGYWITESARVPIAYTEGEFAGAYNPADIRGSYSLADIEASFGIPVDVLARAFGVDGIEDPGAFRASNLEEMYGEQADGGEIGTDALRLFVSLFAGLPYAPEDSTRFPASALVELDAKLATADLQALAARVVAEDALAVAVDPEVAMLSGEETDENAPELAEDHESEEAAIRGKTTFGELLGWGLSREQIEAVLGMEMGPRLMAVRDFAFENGLDYGSVRTELQLLLEADEATVSE